MKVLLFGKLADRVGREVELDLPREGCTVAELRHRLQEALPALAGDLGRPMVKACIDQRIAGEDETVLPSQEVAFIPPLSGG